MGRFIALYRGINVGGKHSVKMESLRALHERLGHRDVATYVQSGNVVFSATGTAEKLAAGIAREFAAEFGFAAPVIVLAAARWGAIVRDNPYAKFAAKAPKTVHAALCQGPPNMDGLKALQAKTGGRETFEVRGDVVYLHAPDGFGTSKFAAGMEKACGVPITVRNWRTVEALRDMVDT